MDKAILSMSTTDLSPRITSSMNSSMLLKHQIHTRNIPHESDHGSDAMQIEVAKKNVDVRMSEASVKRAYSPYTDQDNVRFFKLLFEKCLNASAAAKKAGYPRLTRCNVLLKKAQFQSVNMNSEETIQERLDWARKWERMDMDIRTNFVFLDESTFLINMKHSGHCAQNMRTR
ncbi:hypothetical protein DFQ28_004962 [Apophysomyces sp. BC1034]|nr:hypothetical protein DFQ29_003860 [Apophysomyces sp. BC1021]KAG0188362.1 hypothetical protein DFQ28_004962 [Apophysomyces sp. BC1034]